MRSKYASNTIRLHQPAYMQHSITLGRGAHALAVGGAYFDQPISARVTIFICTLINPRPAGGWLVTRPAGGGGEGGKGPP